MALAVHLLTQNQSICDNPPVSTPEDLPANDISPETVSRFLDPYDDTSVLPAEDGTSIIAVDKVFAKTREVMERMQFDLDTPVAFTDIANLETVGALIASGFGALWVNHIGVVAGDIISANYNHDAASAPFAEPHPYADQFVISDKNWATGRRVIDHHATGYMSTPVVDGLEGGGDEMAEALLATFLIYQLKVFILDSNGHAISR